MLLSLLISDLCKSIYFFAPDDSEKPFFDKLHFFLNLKSDQRKLF